MSIDQVLYIKELGDTNAISINDVNQGWIGDCFVCAPIASLAFVRPDYIQNMIRDNGNGTQSVRLYLDSSFSARFNIAADNSSWITVSDSDLSNGMNTNNGGQLIVDGVQEIWPQVIENAIAQVAGGYNILNYGGFPAFTIYQLTGIAPIETFISPEWGGYNQPTADQLRGDLDSKQIINFFTGSPSQYSLISNHVYSLTSVDTVNGVDYAHFRNPWGYGDPAPIPVSDLSHVFTGMDVGGVPPASTSINAMTIGSGPDRLVLQMSEDAWNGNAQFTVQVDGKQIGDTQTTTAFHSAAQLQAFTVLGTFAGAHTATVTFLNDAYGGTSSTDRNLYVNSASINETTISGASLVENSAGPQSFSFTGPPPASTSITPMTIGSGPDRLVLQMSEDAWNGNAQFTVQVDGKQIGDTQTTTAFHSAAQLQAFTVLGTFAGAHTATVTFLNDAYGGTSSTDRNLYVNSASINETTISGASLVENSAGPQSFSFTGPPPASTSITPMTIGSGPDRLVLQMSEDAWNGNAQFTVQVDGKQIGDTQTTTAFHSAAQLQAFTVLGTFAGAHTATVTFLNDAYGGTPSTDRNLYVNSASINGATVSGASLVEYSPGPQSFNFHTT